MHDGVEHVHFAIGEDRSDRSFLCLQIGQRSQCSNVDGGKTNLNEG